MDLIIKPTQRCNFSCSYCSSTDIAKSNSFESDLEVDKVLQFLKRFPHTRNIIVNGGEPLVVSPNYYEQILSYIDEENLSTKIEFCTNLWGFYKNPDKWLSIFENKRVKVGTSFELGGQRQVSPGVELTKNQFLDIVHHFKSYLGYFPQFISVITIDNFSLAIENVVLAKELGVQCKLNYAVKSGRVGEGVPIGKIYNLYLDIYEAGLSDYEDNTRQVINKVKGIGKCICPHTRSCDEGIRNLQPQSSSGYFYSSCGAFGDDQKYGIDFESEMNGGFIAPLRTKLELQYQKNECLTCENFNLCNSCYKTVLDHKESSLVEESCSLMKSFRKRTKEMNL